MKCKRFCGSGDHPISDRFVSLDTGSKFIAMGRRLEIYLGCRQKLFPKIVFFLRSFQPPLRSWREYCRLNRTMNADFPPPEKNCIQVHAVFLRRRKVRVHSSIQTTVAKNSNRRRPEVYKPNGVSRNPRRGCKKLPREPGWS